MPWNLPRACPWSATTLASCSGHDLKRRTGTPACPRTTGTLEKPPKRKSGWEPWRRRSPSKTARRLSWYARARA
uniref:Uncharacterized protein n=1 Tax=Ixodes ricinus TaxID=34613 RepID=A0A6B0U2V3_IXORI